MPLARIPHLRRGFKVNLMNTANLTQKKKQDHLYVEYLPGRFEQSELLPTNMHG